MSNTDIELADRLPRRACRAAGGERAEAAKGCHCWSTSSTAASSACSTSPSCTRKEDGTISGIALDELNDEFTVFAGASSGLLGEDDYAGAGAGHRRRAARQPYSSNENTWAAPFASALRRSGAQLVANGRIPVNAILAALDEPQQAEA